GDAFAAVLVEAAVGAGHEPFQKAGRLRLAREGIQLDEVRGNALVEVVETLRLLQGRTAVRLGLLTGQQRRQFVPEKALLGDEFVEIQNHPASMPERGGTRKSGVGVGAGQK